MKLAIALAAAGLALAGCAGSEPDTKASAGEYVDAPAVTESATGATPSTAAEVAAQLDALGAEVDAINSEIDAGNLTDARKAELSARLAAISAESERLAVLADATDEPTAEEEEEPAGSPEADYTSSCDYLLDPYTFVATAYITSTGGVPFVAEVKATWKQANGKHVVKTKRVTVKANADEKEVYVTTKASQRQIDLIQALPSEKQCTVKVRIVDTAS